MHYVVRAHVDLNGEGLLIVDAVLRFFAIFTLAVGDFLGPEGLLIDLEEAVVFGVDVIDIPADMAAFERYCRP